MVLLLRYIHEDPHLVPMLKMLRSSGRMTFLVTNRYLVREVMLSHSKVEFNVRNCNSVLCF